MEPEHTLDTGPPSFTGVLFRWAIAVAVIMGPFLLLGASVKVLGVILGIALLGLGILIFDRFASSKGPGAVSNWYRVEWNDDCIVLDITTDTPWRAEIPWVTIRTVALEMVGDPFVSDGLHIWVDSREHAFSIPFDAQNGRELIQELRDRDLLTNELIIEAMGSTGETFVHEVREDRGEVHPALVAPSVQAQ